MQLGVNAALLWRGIRPDKAFSTTSLPYVAFYVWTVNGPQEVDPDSVPDLFAAANAGDVFIALIQRSQELPDWQQFFQRVVGFQDFGTGSDSLGAIVFVATNDAVNKQLRWLAWCFGTGIRSLRRYAVEPRFGLLAALNAISIATGEDIAGDSGRLQEVKYRVTAPYFQQASHRAAQVIPIEAFRVDPRSDLVTEAGGVTGDATFGAVLGGRSFRFATDVNDMSTLVALSNAVFQKAAGTAYKGSFAWVDNITPVSDESLIAKLRRALADFILMTPTPMDVDVMLPDDLPRLTDERPIRYVLYPHERAAKDGSLTFQIGRVKELLRSAGVDALDADLRFLDTSRQELGTSTVLECLVADFMMDNEEYVVDNGSFYSVSLDFVQRVNDEITKVSQTSISLPPHNGELEGPYNARVAQIDPSFILLDRQLIRLPGETTVEAADLLHTSGALVHVKLGARSSTLSHLFLQVQNSCELLRRSPAFRAEFAATAQRVASSMGRDPTGWVFENPARPAGPEVVFGFMGVWQGRTAVNLPLFSRVGLVQAVQRHHRAWFWRHAVLYRRMRLLVCLTRERAQDLVACSLTVGKLLVRVRGHNTDNRGAVCSLDCGCLVPDGQDRGLLGGTPAHDAE